MGYQVIVKQYQGSVPRKAEAWQLDDTKNEQQKILGKVPFRLWCRKWEQAGETRFLLEAEALQSTGELMSLTLEYIPEIWRGEEYVFVPAAVYNGNRFKSIRLSYPPYHAQGAAGEPVITDIPRLDADGRPSRIQFCSGDMSTPAIGYYDQERKEGWLMLAKHMVHSRYTGFTLRQEEAGVEFAVSCPAVREETRYFFGELPDGSGFYPTCGYPSDDEGIYLKEGERLKLEVNCYRIPAHSLTEYFADFHEIRERLETGTSYESIPFSKAYRAVKEKCVEKNFSQEGYLRVGAENEQIPAFWQAGWVGGGMNTYPFLVEDTGEAHRQAISSLHFITEKLQYENGWYVPMYAKGVRYGDDFNRTKEPILLVRKDADLLYFLLKQVTYLAARWEQWDHLEGSIMRQADAMVRFYRENGQLGQFIHIEEETLVQGGTASGAIAPAALALAYEYFGKAEYLRTAEELGELYWRDYLKPGILNGGPGEICQAPDSESAFAFLESCVQLYETTEKECWLRAAKEAFELAVTWVVSYDFNFPADSTAANIGAHTMGTVFANAQNKHSAPGICTLSGNSLLKLYRFTGEEKYLRWLARISHALSQFVSLPERPIMTLEGKNLPSGFFNERVQTSDWEGKETVGGFLYGSNWPETSMLLTYVEVPGIYLDLDRRQLWCMDHVQAELCTGEKGETLLLVQNHTPYDVCVTLLTDPKGAKRKLGHAYFDRMRKLPLGAGETITVLVEEAEA